MVSKYPASSLDPNWTATWKVQHNETFQIPTDGITKLIISGLLKWFAGGWWHQNYRLQNILFPAAATRDSGPGCGEDFQEVAEVSNISDPTKNRFILEQGPEVPPPPHHHTTARI